ncbi:MAG: carbon-nitrogen hydrolase family protein [Acidimicrobiales bacterium]
MIVNALLAQVPVTWNVEDNVATVSSVLQNTNSEDLVVLPEGMISGYDDQLSGLTDLNPAELAGAVDDIARMVRDRGLHLFCGTLLAEDAGWYNAAIYFSPSGDSEIYRKVNLATHERPFLIAGSCLPIINLQFEDGQVAMSPQLCRELRFPDQWHCPARQGAQIFVYLTYSANRSESVNVWRSHLVSRAAETQRFVIATNVAHPDGHCPTLVVSPKGDIIAEILDTEPSIIRASIEVDEVSNWYIGQQRSDVIRINYLN